MTLLNRSLKYLSISLLPVVSLWAVVFYFNMLDEIKESVDEGLENYKRLLIQKARTSPEILTKDRMGENFFSVSEISRERALSARDRYVDTLIDMQDADDETPEPEPVRMLVTAFEQDGRYYTLHIINPMVEEDDLIEELFRETIGLYLILVTSIILINNFVLKRLWKPFYSLLQQLTQYRLGSSEHLPQAKTDTREFKNLQQAVNILLQHTTATYEQQKQFIGNASHELRTPLAIAISKLELLLEKGNLDEVQAGSISEVLQIVERLVRLNKSLLLLAKIENRQFLDNQAVSINKIVREGINDLEEIAAFRNVHISLKETAQLSVRMDAALAGVAVLNLLRNAVFHNVPDGMVHVHILQHAVRVCNTGKTEPLIPEKIFTRFYKPDAGTAGTGLGLAIVKAVCGLYNFTVSYQFDEDMHCFEISFA